MTSYRNQWYKAGYIGNKPLTEKGLRYDNYICEKIADTEGRFTLRNVPLGDYYLTTSVYWVAPVGYKETLVR